MWKQRRLLDIRLQGNAKPVYCRQSSLEWKFKPQLGNGWISSDRKYEFEFQTDGNLVWKDNQWYCQLSWMWFLVLHLSTEIWTAQWKLGCLRNGIQRNQQVPVWKGLKINGKPIKKDRNEKKWSQ